MTWCRRAPLLTPPPWYTGGYNSTLNGFNCHMLTISKTWSTKALTWDEFFGLNERSDSASKVSILKQENVTDHSVSWCLFFLVLIRTSMPESSLMHVVGVECPVLPRIEWFRDVDLQKILAHFLHHSSIKSSALRLVNLETTVAQGRHFPDRRCTDCGVWRTLLVKVAIYDSQLWGASRIHPSAAQRSRKLFQLFDALQTNDNWTSLSTVLVHVPTMVSVVDLSSRKLHLQRCSIVLAAFLILQYLFAF